MRRDYRPPALARPGRPPSGRHLPSLRSGSPSVAGMWLLLLLALDGPAVLTGAASPLSPALPLTLRVDGMRRSLVVCLVLDVAPGSRPSRVWLTGANGSALDAVPCGPRAAADGSWTSLARLSLPAAALAAWEPVACRAAFGAGGRRAGPWALRPAGEVSTVTGTCFQEPLRGTRGLRLGALRLLLFKLLLLDVLLTCSGLRFPGSPPRPEDAPASSASHASQCRPGAHQPPSDPFQKC